MLLGFIASSALVPDQVVREMETASAGYTDGRMILDRFDLVGLVALRPLGHDEGNFLALLQ